MIHEHDQKRSARARAAIVLVRGLYYGAEAEKPGGICGVFFQDQVFLDEELV